MCGMLWLPVRPRETGGTNVIPLTASPSWSSSSASDSRSGKYGLQLTSPIGTQSFLAEPRSLTLSGHVSSCTWKGHDPDLAGAPTQGGGTEALWALTVLVDRATKCFATAEGCKR